MENQSTLSLHANFKGTLNWMPTSNQSVYYCHRAGLQKQYCSQPWELCNDYKHWMVIFSMAIRDIRMTVTRDKVGSDSQVQSFSLVRWISLWDWFTAWYLHSKQFYIGKKEALIVCILILKNQKKRQEKWWIYLCHWLLCWFQCTLISKHKLCTLKIYFSLT
jgi:hypothetical protein